MMTLLCKNHSPEICTVLAIIHYNKMIIQENIIKKVVVQTLNAKNVCFN